MVMSMVAHSSPKRIRTGTSTLGLGARDFRQFVKSQPNSRVIFTLRLAREIVIVTFTQNLARRPRPSGRGGSASFGSDLRY